jgi:hypothetical protein
MLGQKKKVGVAPSGAPRVLGERHWCAPCCRKQKKKGKKTDTTLTRQFRVTIQTLQTLQTIQSYSPILVIYLLLPPLAWEKVERIAKQGQTG